jgi:hypothetical protein
MQVPEEIKKAYANGSFGIYVGSGMSVASGLPNWDTLLSDLCRRAKDQGVIDQGKRDELLSLIQQNKPLLVAQDLKDIYAADLYRYIKEIFDAPDLKPTATLVKLIKLRYKFIVTTNYDTLLENAYVQAFQKMPRPLTYKDASTINFNLLNNIDFILKAHGDASKSPSEIILTENDYRRIIFSEYGYQSVMHVLFSSYNILFVGVSLKDPELMLILSFIHTIFHGGSPKHFALIDEKTLTKTERDRWRKDYNIEIIPYDSHDSHIEVDNFIEQLSKLK